MCSLSLVNTAPCAERKDNVGYGATQVLVMVKSAVYITLQITLRKKEHHVIHLSYAQDIIVGVIFKQVIQWYVTDKEL